MKVPVYILAGGRSRRFGSDKARVCVDGVPQLLRMAALTETIASSVTVVAAESGAYGDLGLRTIGDMEPGLGPIGGLLTAIHDAGEGWLLLTACDWVGLEAGWLAALLTKIPEASSVICYETDRYEPLLTLYHTSIRGGVLSQIGAGELAMHRLFVGLDITVLPPPAGWRRAENLNRPPR